MTSVRPAAELTVHEHGCLDGLISSRPLRAFLILQVL